MLWKFQSTVNKQLSSIYYRMHKYILTRKKAPYLIPCKYFFSRNDSSVIHYPLMCGTFFFVYIVAYHHVKLCVGLICKEPKFIKYLHVRSLIQPVIRVYDLEKHTACSHKPCHYSSTVSAIFLMYGFANSRIFFLIPISYLFCIIFK